MTGLDLGDIDPDVGDLIGDPPPEPDEEHIARLTRAYRYIAAEQARRDRLWAREIERLNTSRAEQAAQAARRLDAIAAICQGWGEMRRSRQAAAGTPEDRLDKSWPFPDGRVQSRATRPRVVTAGAPPAVFARTKEVVAWDVGAVLAAVDARDLAVCDDGSIVDAETGELIEGATYVPAGRSWSVVPAQDEPEGDE